MTEIKRKDRGGYNLGEIISREKNFSRMGCEGMVLSVGSVSLSKRIRRSSGHIGKARFTVREQRLHTEEGMCGSQDKLCSLCILMEEYKSFDEMVLTLPEHLKMYKWLLLLKTLL